MASPALKNLLGECADAVVRTSDWTDIPCCKFTCLSSCSVLRDLIEACDPAALHTTPDGKLIIPVPGISTNALKLAIDLVHGLSNARDLSLEDTLLAYTGLDVLGCHTLNDDLDTQLWALVSPLPLAGIKQHMGRLLRSLRHRDQVLNMLVRLAPLWKDVKLLVEEELELDAKNVVWVAKELMRFFPPATVVCLLIDALPMVSRSSDIILQLVGIPESGSHYHPAEIVSLLKTVVRVFRSKKWDPLVMRCLNTFIESNRLCDVAPHKNSGVSGTTWMCDAEAMASAHLTFHKPLTRQRAIEVAPWLYIRVLPYSGHVMVTIIPWKLDEVGQQARNIQLRVTAGAGHSLDHPDVWYEWHNLTVTRATQLSLSTVDHTFGSHEALHRAVRCSSLKSLRFDAFYGASSILDRPLREYELTW